MIEYHYASDFRAICLGLERLAGRNATVAYVNPNVKTKKALKDLLASGKTVEVFQPGQGTVPENGTVALEGPHFPAPHTWYGTGTMKDGKLVSVK